MKNIRVFLSENFHFLEVKFSVYLNRRVFVMLRTITINAGDMACNNNSLDCRLTKFQVSTKAIQVFWRFRCLKT